MKPCEARDRAEARYLARLEAAALLFLNERDDLLCEMSRNDGEWPNGAGISRKRVKRMRALRGIMQNEAEGVVPDEDGTELIWGVLNRICETHDYDPTVWGLNWERDNP